METEFKQMCATYRLSVMTFGKLCPNCPITPHLKDDPYESCFVWRHQHPEQTEQIIKEWIENNKEVPNG